MLLGWTHFRMRSSEQSAGHLPIPLFLEWVVLHLSRYGNLLGVDSKGRTLCILIYQEGFFSSIVVFIYT